MADTRLYSSIEDINERLRIYYEVLDLSKKGFTYQQIINFIKNKRGVQLSYTTVRLWILGKQHPLGRWPEGKYERLSIINQFSSRDDLRRKLMELYYEQKLSMAKIAEVFNVYPSTIRQLFKELDIRPRPVGYAISIALSKGKYRPFDPEKDVELTVELNALLHTDFWKRKDHRKVVIMTSTTRLGMVIFLDRIAERHKLPPPKCTPKHLSNERQPLSFRTRPEYQWRIYLTLDESFWQTLENDTIRYMRQLANTDKELLFLYLTRFIECDGMISVSARNKRGIVTGNLGFISKNPQYLLCISDLLESVFGLPASVHLPKENETCGHTYTWLLSPGVMDFLNKMNFLHLERLWRKELALKYVGLPATPEIIEEINNVRRAIKLLRDITTQVAKERYLLPRGKRALESGDLIKIVLQRFLDQYLERYPNAGYIIDQLIELLKKLGIRAP